jgi:DNA polymerase II small subunit/DNA polymerase delta subunit B
MVKLTLEIANLVGFKALKDFLGYMKQFPNSGSKIQQEYDESIEGVAKVIVACVVADGVNPGSYHVVEEKKESALGMQQRIKNEMMRLKNQQLANETIDISETDDEDNEDDPEVYVPIKSQARPTIVEDRSPCWQKLNAETVARILSPQTPQCDKCAQLKIDFEKQLADKNAELKNKDAEIKKLRQDLAIEMQEKTQLAQKCAAALKDYENELRDCAENLYEVVRKRMRE